MFKSIFLGPFVMKIFLFHWLPWYNAERLEKLVEWREWQQRWNIRPLTTRGRVKESLTESLIVISTLTFTWGENRCELVYEEEIIQRHKSKISISHVLR